MNKKENIAERLKTYRVENGYSQQDFADLVGVTTVTILRWENGTSKPSSLAAQKLEEIGFGKVEIGDTKQVSKPRLAINKDSAKLRKDIRAAIRLGNQNYAFSPARYVVNGPEDQLGFYETLYKFQEDNSLRDLDTVKRYARRLSLVDSIPELGITTSQSELEKPKEGYALEFELWLSWLA